MKILGIAGSPRAGGNSTIMIEEALKAVAGRVETEIVALADLIPPDHAAPAREHVDTVVDKIETAEAIILASPGYFGMPSAALKAVLDATWEHATRRRLEGKVGAALVAHGGTGGESAALALGHYFTLQRMRFVGYVVGSGLKEREVLFDIKSIREARELAHRVVDALEATPS